MLRDLTASQGGFELLVRQGEESLRCALPENRPFLLGQAPDNDLVLREEGIRPHHALIWVEGDQAWIRHICASEAPPDGEAPRDEAAPLPLQSPVPLGAFVWLQLCRPDPNEPYPYRLAVSSPERLGARAVLADLEAGGSCALSAGNPLTALYLLASQLQADRARDLLPAEQGWCRHEDLAKGVWGHSWRRRLDNHLHVLLHRLRARIAQSGLNPHCIETRHGATRLLLREVEIR